jgi:hypothetical protein
MRMPPRGYALLVVLFAVAVATALLLRNLTVRPAAETMPSSLVLWHDAHAALTRCIHAHDLRGVDEPSILARAASGHEEVVKVSGGACRLTFSTGPGATVFTVRVLEPAETGVAASVIRRRGEAPMLVYRP